MTFTTFIFSRLTYHTLVSMDRFTVKEESYTLKIPIQENYIPNVQVQVLLIGSKKYAQTNAKTNCLGNKTVLSLPLLPIRWNSKCLQFPVD